MKKFKFPFAAMVALTTLVCSNARAFDISAYWDPISMVQLEGHGQSGLQDCAGDSDRACWINAISVTHNAEVLQWYREMGITNLCVYYSPTDYEDYLGACEDTLAVMNERWPERMYQFLEAQGNGRRAVVTDNESPYVDTTRCTGSRGCNTIVTLRQINQQLGQREVLAIGPGNGTPEEFFRPVVGFDTWVGWGRREFSDNWRLPDSTLDYVMPLVFRLVLDYDRDPNAPTAEIGKFYWYFQNAEDEWLRYYPVTIDTTMIQHRAGQFDTLVIRIDPIDYTCVRYDTLCDSLIYVFSSPFDSVPSRSLDYDYFGAYDVSWYGREGRFEIHYAGWHTLYVYSVEVMDDAYYKMFEAGPTVASQTEEQIVAAFSDNKDLWPYMRGWYYDEIHGPFLRSWLRVQQILHNDSRNLPTFFYNGNAFDDDRHNLEMDSIFYYQTHGLEGSLPSTFMLETYYFYGDSTGVGLWWPYPAFLYTRISSDGPYADTTRSWEDFDREDHPIKRFNGTQSLQRTIDFTYWKPPDDQIRPFLSSWQNDHIADMEIYPGFFDQVQLQHERDSKLWALLQSGSCGPYDVSEESSPDSDWVGDSFQGFSWRKPTSNEIKLEAWLAVAGNADGIMWYWGTPSGVFDPGNGKYQPIGGLFDWDSASDFCVSGGAWLNRTDRDSAAGQVHRDILRVAPVLESLDFVRTFAGRAFERNYASCDSPWVKKEVLLETDSTNSDLITIETFYGEREHDWRKEGADSTYVQVSRFKLRDIPNNVEDYWFLIVNRRALENETRRIQLVIDSVRHPAFPFVYFYEQLLEGSVNPELPDNGRITIKVTLDPGEAELVHVFCSQAGCDTTLAHIDSLTITPFAPGKVRLNWEEITETDEGFPFDVECYFIYASVKVGGPWTPIGLSTTTSYVDSIFAAAHTRHYYTVQACEYVPSR